MIAIYLAMTVAGIALTIVHRRQRSMRTWIAMLGTLLAAFAVATGFSIGPYVALVAGLVLLVAAMPRRHRSAVV